MNWNKAKSQGFTNEKNDCAVKAVSIVCDVPYAVAHKALALCGRKPRKGTPMTVTNMAMIKLGFKMEQDKSLKIPRTVKRLENHPTVAEGYHVAVTTNHILAIVNGRVEDWTRGKTHRPLATARVTPFLSRKERKQRIREIMEA